MAGSAPRIYLAGPDVFYPDAKARGAARCTLCAGHGLSGVFPLDADIDGTGLSPIEFGYAIYRANIALINSCDGVIADMTPFRGPSADPGTTFEMGYALGRGMPVFAYTEVHDLFEDRLAKTYGPLTTDDQGHRTDRDGFAVERFGMVDNLMLDGACIDAGLSHPFRPAFDAEAHSAFLDAVRRAAEFFSRRRSETANLLSAR